jgi:hypothetical protein
MDSFGGGGLRGVEASRLNSFSRDVASALREAPADARQRAADYAAAWAVARTGLDHPVAATGTADDAAALTAELDERYFALSEERDAGRASTDQVAAAFEQARAASAVEFARRGDAAEALYEAAAAAEDWSELRAGLLSLLRV